MRIGLLAFFLLVFTAQIGYAQNKKRYIDSLLTIANKVSPDSNSVNALTTLQRFYFERGQYDSVLKYAKRTLPISRQLKNTKSQARVNYNLGLIYTNLSNYDSAEFYLNEALALMPITKDTVAEINIYNALALLSNKRSNYVSAVEYLLKSVERIDQSGNPDIKQWLPQAYSNIGHNLIAEKQIEKGIDYARKALLIKNYPNEERYRILLNLDVFDAYLQLSKLETSKPYLDSAIALSARVNNLVISTMVANNEGNYYVHLNDVPNAKKAYARAYLLCDSTGNLYLKAEVGGNLASLNFKTGNYAEAEKYANEANAIGRELKHFKVSASTYAILKKLASRQGDFKNALAYADLYKTYADSATNQETQNATLLLESKYQNQKKERELAALTITNTQNELEVVKRNRLLIVGGVVASASMIIIGLFYRNSRQKQLLAESEGVLQKEQIKFLERQQQVVSLQSMINGQEAERTRIAKDLHDGLGGLFSTVKMYFSSLQHDMPELKEKELFQKSYSLVDSASVEIRGIAHSMMPEVLMRLGLVNALKDLCDNISAGKLIKVSLEVHGIQNRFNANTEIMLYRIIQELLNNIMKHANATEVIIQFIREAERLSVAVEDNGQGFNTQQFDESKSSGLETVKSRVSYLNGKLSIDSEKGIGTTIMMDFLINE